MGSNLPLECSACPLPDSPVTWDHVKPQGDPRVLPRGGAWTRGWKTRSAVVLHSRHVGGPWGDLGMLRPGPTLAQESSSPWLRLGRQGGPGLPSPTEVGPVLTVCDL